MSGPGAHETPNSALSGGSLDVEWNSFLGNLDLETPVPAPMNLIDLDIAHQMPIAPALETTTPDSSIAAMSPEPEVVGAENRRASEVVRTLEQWNEAQAFEPGMFFKEGSSVVLEATSPVVETITETVAQEAIATTGLESAPAVGRETRFAERSHPLVLESVPKTEEVLPSEPVTEPDQVESSDESDLEPSRDETKTDRIPA